MPKKKVTFKTAANGTIYVYYTLRAYRNKNGKPTSDEASIGKKDPVTEMLIPNRKYFELFQSSTLAGGITPVKPSMPCRVASYGNSFSLVSAARATGLQEILSKCFPESWPFILAVSCFMLCEGNVMLYLEDWFDETDIAFAERIDDQRCSRLFAAISHDERMHFFREWLKHRSEQEYIVYDVTSISTYSKGIDIAEWGYNRDNESIPQINLGMFYGAESHLPVYYNMYSGSISDKSHLVFMMADAKRLGIANTRFVLDRGFVSEGNLKHMKDKGYLFITAFPQHLLEAKRLVDACKSDIRKAANRIGTFGVYALSTDTEVYGFKMKAHIYFDPEKQALDEKELYAHVEKLKTDLEKMGKTKRATKKYTDFFIVKQEKTDGFIFTLNNEKIDERLSRAGFFILLNNDECLSSEDVLRLYRGRDAIEKNFDQLKNGLDFRRLRTHVNQTTDGKMFVGFLALILRSYLLRKLKDDQKTKHLTLEKVLLELRKIKVVTFEDLSRVLIPLTKIQKTILDVLGLSVNELQCSFS
jgi:transposase